MFYRYGAFQPTSGSDTGRIVPALLKPDGHWVEDKRTNPLQHFEWLSDPLIENKVAVHHPRLLLNKRYLILARLQATARGAVFLAVDINTGRSCVVKVASRHSLVQHDGTHAGIQLANEFAALSFVQGLPGAPEIVEWLPGDNSFLITSEVRGETLPQWLKQYVASGKPKTSVVSTVGQAIGRSLVELHARGVFHRDLSPTNVMVRSDGTAVLIDLGLAYHPNSRAVMVGGTPGYVKRSASGHPSALEDIYGFGAILFYIATGGDPPPTSTISANSIRNAAPDIDSGIEYVITRSLNANEENVSLVSLLQALP
ncbi:protein kinase domain-containing protein [Rhizobium leguminosarum]|uniref:protein kinase domain-containing protein n=1 Tax=Rhizobium leguminosarum TaxID=384 RepID=UPI001C91062A|nr:protein kinase [Rhizobium leguminosarum]MBY2998405.1 protein kinase [Rhizobium leguminosarum]